MAEDCGISSIAEDLGCRLCGALVDGELSTLPLIENQFYRRWQFQTMLPAKGQLTLGHALIITKKHFASYGSAPLEIRTEYQKIATQARVSYPDFLEIEHGADSNGNGGGCITHAHIHWFPDLGVKLEEIAQILGVSSTPINNLLEKQDNLPSHSSYLFVRNKDRSILFQTKILQTQIVRQLVAAVTGITTWDWRSLPDVQNLSPLKEWNLIE